MNPIHKFYTTLFTFLHAVREGATEESLRSHRQAVTKRFCAGVTFSVEELSSVEQLLIDGELRASAGEAIFDLLKAAFKDLCVLKNPDAMALFADLRRLCYVDTELTFAWAKKVHERVDGSAIITLHVSNYKRFASYVTRFSGGDIKDAICEVFPD